ncbi:alpha/beta-hydrolase [Neocallimastix lanati (nom. inval.)]|uniref:Alpha/beta-hydrolase n=1 Tax=Neocallimastix californiae TaxID=1754190 RepID=A0A1Y2FJE0_9FUNG|nr:alpha/beta-hydrolase [Neocallimastix sp. JGI-2020a]ORY84060.1 alpha/beta-hydrolase [Neocallimastix californiae]|eukprot:ORY84060.1 alpha/beta-hydrolase [Neocallimastix californiae]
MNAKLILKALLYVTALFSVSVEGKAIRKCIPKASKSAIGAQMIVQDHIEREIIDAYNTDASGKKQKGPSKYVALEFTVKAAVIPSFGVSMGGEASPFTYDMDTGRNSWSTNYELDLDLKEGKSFKVGKLEYGGDKKVWKTFKYNLADNYVVPETKEWKKDSFTAHCITLQRASFTPKGVEKDGGKNPLVIWLHGAGEGGRDIDITLLGNEVTALAKEGIQKYFISDDLKGAYVLAVQTPTMWMDRGNSAYNNDISDYVANNSDIDTDRIYIGGCSNGGYMTMNMMFEHGDFFTAFYPICEAYMDRNISEDMIEDIKDYNIWFLHSEDDTTVDPLATSISTYYRLMNAGAKNVHYTLTDHVIGTDDPEVQYMGHYSWVYAFNDQVKKQFDNAKVVADFENITIKDGKVTTTDNYVTNANCSKDGNMWSWLASQRKN